MTTQNDLIKRKLLFDELRLDYALRRHGIDPAEEKARLEQAKRRTIEIERQLDRQLRRLGIG